MVNCGGVLIRERRAVESVGDARARVGWERSRGDRLPGCSAVLFHGPGSPGRLTARGLDRDVQGRG